MKILTNIDVSELRPAIDFYEAALGLTCTRILDDDVAELTGASSVIYLLRKDAGSNATHQPPSLRQYGRHWTPVHLDFVVNDLDDAVRQALRAGAKQESECVEWRGSKCVSFADPFGHGFCLIELTGGTYSADAT